MVVRRGTFSTLAHVSYPCLVLERHYIFDDGIFSPLAHL
jgi:hypothetical protein